MFFDTHKYGYSESVFKTLYIEVKNKQLKSDSHLPKKFLFICFNESPLKMMKNASYFI